jgi:predicted O-methyltransferase YrrM
MTIAAVCTSYNEADIIETTIRHLLAEGVDFIWFADASTDGTLDILSDLSAEFDNQIFIYRDQKGYHDQPYWIDRLAELSHSEWIIPFDADEFICPRYTEKTIAETLNELPASVKIVTMPMYQHRDWNHLDHIQKPMVKVAYRWEPGAHIWPGNHGVDLPSVTAETTGHVASVLSVREIQFRSFEHFCRKIRERCETMDPELLARMPNAGHHVLQYRDATKAELEKVWYEYESSEWTWDPIPSRIQPPDHLVGEVEQFGNIHNLANYNEHIGWSDIKGHLGRMREIVAETNAQLIIELGVNTGVSTATWLSALEETGGMLYSVDISYPRVPWEVAAQQTENWRLYIQDDLTWSPPLEPCDILFIDTSHTHDHTSAELKRFSPCVRDGGCIILHDEDAYPEQARATRHFIHWIEAQGRKPTKIERYHHDNGLVVIWL